MIYFYSHIQEACGTIKRVKFQVKSSCCHVHGRRPRRPSQKARGDHFFVATLAHTYKLNLSRSCLRLTLGRIRMRFFVSFCWSKRYADSNAIVVWFVFVATLTHISIYIYIYKRCGNVHTYIYLVIFVTLGLSSQVLDIHVNTRRKAALCQTKEHQNNVPP